MVDFQCLGDCPGIVAGLDDISLSYGFRFGFLRSRWLRLFLLFIDRLDQSRRLLLSERVVDATSDVKNTEMAVCRLMIRYPRLSQFQRFIKALPGYEILETNQENEGENDLLQC